MESENFRKRKRRTKVSRREEKMEKNIRIGLLKKGGKKALEQYNKLNRVTGPAMNLGTRVHQDMRYRKPKHKAKLYEED